MDYKKYLAVLGYRIKEIRTQNNISQNELAMRCDFDKATMSRIESGKANPTVQTLYKICNALDVHIGELFTGRP